MSSLRVLLWPLSVLYGIGARVRGWGYRRGILSLYRLSKPVISVGNLTVGGTGKTPVVLWIAERLMREGNRVGILTRGYKGTEAGNGRNVRTDGSSGSDEANLLASRLGNGARLGIGPDRIAAGRELESWADCFILDDGFQHLRIWRDVNIVLIDSTDPFGGGLLLPAGNLREPKSALARADIVVITRTVNSPAIEAEVHRYTRSPIFYATTALSGDLIPLSPSGTFSSDTQVKPVPQKFFAFCGIGNPRAFFNDLHRWGIETLGHAVFRDHHRYSQKDVEVLERKAQESGAEALVCTEKDIFNLSRLELHKTPVHYCSMRLELGDPDGFWRAVKSGLARGPGEAVA